MSLDSIATWLGYVAVQNAITTTIMALIVGQLCRAYAKNPAAQNLLWLLVLLKFMLPPLPGLEWRLAVAPAAATAEAGGPMAMAPVGDELAPSKFIETEAPLPAEVVPTDFGGASSRGDLHDSASILSKGLGVRIVAGAWLAAALVIFARGLARGFRRYRLVRQGRLAQNPLAETVDRVARRLGLRKLLTRVVQGIDSPFLCCLGRVQLAWPERMAESPEPNLRAIVAHEVAHVRRGDHWVAWVELLCTAIWWWNPVFWRVRRRLRLTAEMSCDALALSTYPEDRCSYAETLLWLSASRKTGAPPLFLAVGGGAPSSIERRMSMIVSDRVSGKASSSSFLVAGLLAIIAAPSWSLSREQTSPDRSERVSFERLVEEAGESSDTRLLGEARKESGEERRAEPTAPEAEAPHDEADEARVRHVLRLKAMYFTALADKRADDAEALKAALEVLETTSATKYRSNGVRKLTRATLELGRKTLADRFPLRDYDLMQVRVRVTGSSQGTIWGSDVYTDDSPIAVAAVHAGLVEVGQTADLMLFAEPSRKRYLGVERNGIRSEPYGEFAFSYRLAKVEPTTDAPYLCSRVALRGNSDAYLTLNMLSGQVPFVPGATLVVPLIGKPSESVWGTGEYSADSSLDAAAVHAGILQPGESALVRVTLTEGNHSYEGSTQNGVTSREAPSGKFSLKFEPVKTR